MKPINYINVSGEGLYPPIDDDQIPNIQNHLRIKGHHFAANIIEAYIRIVSMPSDRRENICKTIQENSND